MDEVSVGRNSLLKKLTSKHWLSFPHKSHVRPTKPKQGEWGAFIIITAQRQSLTFPPPTTTVMKSRLYGGGDLFFPCLLKSRLQPVSKMARSWPSPWDRFTQSQTTHWVTVKSPKPFSAGDIMPGEYPYRTACTMCSDEEAEWDCFKAR